MSLLICWSPIGDFRQNFGRQKFCPLAIATKMVKAWSTVVLTYPEHDLLSLASDSGSEDVFCLLRTTLLPPSPAGGWPVAPTVTGTPGANREIK